MECTRKTEWDKFVVKILTFWSKSKVQLVQSSPFILFYLLLIFLGCSDPGQISGLGPRNRVKLKWEVTSLMTLGSVFGACDARGGV